VSKINLTSSLKTILFRLIQEKVKQTIKLAQLNRLLQEAAISFINF